MRPRVSLAAMRRMLPLLAIFLAITAAATSAVAQPAPPAARPARASWDSRGWVPLGERTVNGRFDRDRIPVGHQEGKFSKLTMVVEDSDLELIDFKIVFGDRTEYHPTINQVFREGQRTRVIDLPPSESVIQHIDIKYKNLRGGGDARVQIWGLRAGGPPPPVAPPPVVRRSWDTRGWVLLGSRQVNGRADRDRIEVGRDEGRFTKLTLAVEDSDLELIDLRIEFADRTSYSPRLSHFFREGQRTKVIDLPPSEQIIRHVDLTYKNTRGGGPASVEVWGLRQGGAPPPPPPPPPSPVTWDARGWTLLGERTVDRRYDRDRITVDRQDGRFTKLTLVVEDSDLELIDMAVHFYRGRPWRPALSHYFREGQRTRAIDLPGDDRGIKHIELRYKNLPGGGNARVKVYGLRDTRVWDTRGWTMLGEQRVAGRGADTDRISVQGDDTRYKRLTLVVLDSDLEMEDMTIQFERGEPYRPRLDAVFRENSRTRVIDLPRRGRRIEWIEFKYRNLPGGGDARVQVWAK